MHKRMRGELEVCVFKTSAQTSIEKRGMRQEMQEDAENNKKYSKNKTIFPTVQVIVCHKLRSKRESVLDVQTLVFSGRKENYLYWLARTAITKGHKLSG